MQRTVFVSLATFLLAGCVFEQRLIYPKPEPGLLDEENLTAAKCDMAGPPRSCFDVVRFRQRGGVTEMITPQCAQVTITDERPTDDPKHLRKGNIFIEPHITTVVGDRDAQMEVVTCLQFPLRERQQENLWKPTYTITREDCMKNGNPGAGAAACLGH